MRQCSTVAVRKISKPTPGQAIATCSFLLWMEYLDGIIMARRAAHVLHVSTYAIGRNRRTPYMFFILFIFAFVYFYICKL